MDQASVHGSSDVAPLHTCLPGDRSHWPQDARCAYHALLRELDAWCRHCGWPTSRNAAVAEEAVRQTW